MLSFIANLPEEQLREARARGGAIASADLYRLLIERWLEFEYERAQPRGAAPTLTVEERWEAATAIALHLWPKLERTALLSELHEQVAEAVGELSAERMLDSDTATHLVGGRNVCSWRDEGGRFAFVHQSVMEWLVANHAAEQLKSGAEPYRAAGARDDGADERLLRDPDGRTSAGVGAASARAEPGGRARGKANALLILEQLGVAAERVSLLQQNLSGRSLSGQNLAGADLRGARTWPRAQLDGADLSGANLAGAILEGADLTHANLRGARLPGARAARAKLLGADLRDAILDGADLRYAKLVGARLPAAGLGGANTFGAALPGDGPPEPTTTHSAARCSRSPGCPTAR